MKALLLVVLLLTSAWAQTIEDREASYATLADLGARQFLMTTGATIPTFLPRQTQTGMLALEPEGRWMLPAEALPLLATVRVFQDGRVLAPLELQIQAAHELGLAEQELALRVLAMRAADLAQRPLDVRKQLPAARELVARVPGERGRILAFEVATYGFVYEYVPRHPDLTPGQWAEAYAAASALLPRQDLTPATLGLSFGLWHTFAECLLAWMLEGARCGAVAPVTNGLNQDIAWLAHQSERALRLEKPRFEVTLATASLLLQLGSAQPETLGQSRELLEKFRPALLPFDKGLREANGYGCLDTLDELQAIHTLFRIELGQTSSPGPDLGAAKDLLLDSPTADGLLELAITADLLMRRARNLPAAEESVAEFLKLPNFSRLARSQLLTMQASLWLEQGKTAEARQALFEARALQLEYLADLGASSARDQQLFAPTLELTKKLDL